MHCLTDHAQDRNNPLCAFQLHRFYTVYSGPSLSDFNLASAKDFKADEDAFLIFYFTFLLEEFAAELERLVDALDLIHRDGKAVQKARSRPLWRRLLMPTSCVPTGRRSAHWRNSLAEKPYWKHLAGLFTPPSPAIKLPSIQKHQPNTSQTPIAQTKTARLNRLIWRAGERLRSPETKFAIKTGLGCASLAAPAFISATRKYFKMYEGQWALISFLVVLSPTVGQSNQMSIHRILGTLAGAGTALVGYTLFPDDNIILPSEFKWTQLFKCSMSWIGCKG